MRELVVRVVIPLRSQAGNVWHTIERERAFQVSEPAPDCPVRLSLPFAVGDRPVTAAAVVRLAHLLTVEKPEVVFDPIVVDPPSASGAGVLDEHGRVDGYIVNEYEAAG